MIIAISGKKGSGKDTVGKIIQHIQPEYDWQIKKYAGKLKEVAGLILGIAPHNFEDEGFKNSYLSLEWNYTQDYFNQFGVKVGIGEHQMTIRTFLQRLGTEGGRAVHPEIWINALYADYQCIPADRAPNGWDCPNWLITDCRFPNEFKAAKDKGGFAIRIERDDILRLGKEDTDKHPSETALDNVSDWDAIIYNNGTQEELMKQVTETLNKLTNETKKSTNIG